MDKDPGDPKPKFPAWIEDATVQLDNLVVEAEKQSRYHQV